MRILQISPTYAPLVGGLESYLTAVVGQLRKHVHTVVATGVPGPPSEEVVLRSDLLGPDRLLGRTETPGGCDEDLVRLLSEELLSLAGEIRPQVVHFHNAHHFGPEMAVAAMALSPVAATVNTAHDHTGNFVCPTSLEVGWSSVLYVSSFLSRALPSSRPSTVLPLGVDLELFRPCAAPHRDMEGFETPRIFHPARLLRWKGVADSVAAFSMLRQRLGRGSLVLCGSTNIVDDSAEVSLLRAELQADADAAGWGEHLHFIAPSYAEMPAAYAASDLVWYPTREDEPFGLVPLEANACGRPVVVTESGGMAETVSHGVSGLRVGKGHPSELAEASFHILTRSELRERLVAGGLAKAEEFSLERHVEALIEHYSSLSDG